MVELRRIEEKDNQAVGGDRAGLVEESRTGLAGNGVL